jgi:ribose/xylose/arabinose/galactoside ABC-type transport system permease subunit
MDFPESRLCYGGADMSGQQKPSAVLGESMSREPSADSSHPTGPTPPERPFLAMFRWNLSDFALVPAIVVLCVVGAFVNKAFLTPANILTILQQSSILALVVLAESLVLICGKFDLSLESTVGLAPMIGAWLLTPVSIGGSGLGLDPYLAIGVTLGIGVMIGWLNGLLIVRLKLNAFIVTLSMLILLRGITLGFTSGKTLYGIPAPFVYLGSATWAGVPVSIWVSGLFFLLSELFMRRHRLGRAIYAIGGNPEAARAAGIRVERVSWLVFIVAGFLAALAGLMLSGRLGAVTCQQGSNMIFVTFAAAVIGGISLNGGRGSMFGALTGVLLLGIVTNLLTLSQIASFWIDATFGAIILVAQAMVRLTGGSKIQD